MPLFRFKGIDVFGTIYRGKIGAPTEKHLCDQMLMQGIVILVARPIYRFQLRFISTTDKITFYRNLAQLLSSGVLLPDALEYIAVNSKNLFFQDTVYELSMKISSGYSFYQALKNAPYITSSTILFMVNASQQSAHLEKTCAAIADYLERTKTFKKNLLSIIFMPILTLGALLTLFCVISNMMLPRLLEMMKLFKNKQNNLENKIIFKILNFITLRFFIYVIGIFSVLCVILFLIHKTKRGTIFLHTLLLHIPLIKTIIIQTTFSRIFFILSLLLSNGIPLTHALDIITQSTPIYPIKMKLHGITESIKNGMMLSGALAKFFGVYDSYASLMIRIAEKSGTMAQTCDQIAKDYNANIQKTIEYGIMIMQPTLIILIGLLISLLMISLYAPLAEFSMMI